MAGYLQRLQHVGEGYVLNQDGVGVKARDHDYARAGVGDHGQDRRQDAGIA